MFHEKHITLSELLADVSSTLAERFPLGVWISAEIGELKVNRYSGHCYLELIEKGDKDGTPKAKASATIWRSRWGAIESYFRATTGTDLVAGMSVLLKVSVSFHEAYGFSLTVSDIDPAYTLGENERRKREVIAALEADGIIDLNRSLALPAVIQRVAVISSATAAGLQDFRNHLAESPYRIEHTLFEAIVQGASAEESIIGALEEIAGREEEFDAVAIIRGGGSQSDLECFNSYALCAHIAQFPLPILTGIGHDKDSSVADLVAAWALKTPTAVADFLLSRIEGFLSEAEDAYGRITALASHTLSTQNANISLLGARLLSTTRELLGSLSLRLHASSMRLRHATERTLQNNHSKLNTAEALVGAASPERILALGFAMIQKGGRTITDSSQLSEGESVEILLAKGSIEATITKKND